MTTWVIRCGKHGEHEQWCLSEGVAGGGWGEIQADLSKCTSREEVRAIVDATYPGESLGRQANGVSSHPRMACRTGMAHPKGSTTLGRHSKGDSGSQEAFVK